MSERSVGLKYIKNSEPGIQYWRINRVYWQDGDEEKQQQYAAESDQDAIHAIKYDGFMCIEQSMSDGYRLIGRQNVAEQWKELFHFFQTPPDIIAPDPNSEDPILREFYTMSYRAGYYSKPGIQPSESEMMSALHGLFSERI